VPASLAQDFNSSITPSLYDSFLSLIQINKRNKANIGNNFTDVLKVPELDFEKNEYSLPIDFVQMIIFQTEFKVLQGQKSKLCGILEILWFKLHDPSFKDYYLPIISKAKNSEQTKNYLIEPKGFIEKLIPNKCPASISILSSLKINKFSELPFYELLNAPNDLSSCKSRYEQLSSSAYRNYFFYLQSILDQSQKLYTLKELDKDQKKLMIQAKVIEKKLQKHGIDAVYNITHANNEEDFCDFYFKGDFFDKVSKNPSNYKNLLSNLCSNQDINKCVEQLALTPERCLKKGVQSFTPGVECNALGNHFESAKIKFEESDCPARIEQEGVVNAARSLSILEKFPTQKNGLYSCIGDNLKNFIDFNQEMGKEDQWNSYLCYKNPISKKEKCLKTFFSSDQANSISIVRRISEALKETKKVRFAPTCDFEEQSVFFRNSSINQKGCKIIFNNENCFLNRCPFKVAINGRIIESDFKLKSNFNFSYLSDLKKGQRNSFQSRVQRKYKLKEKKLYNLTQLKSVLQSKKVMIHGIGCAEDFLPNFYTRKTFNQCLPLPFLITGIIERKNALTEGVLIQLSIDNAQTYRQFSWKKIKTAVENLQQNHPTRSWGLNALYND
jgi:hypothetical protein